MPFVELSGVRLWYTDTGGGVPVILMHAASGTSDCWVQQLPAFTGAGFRCIAYDRRGWGRSEPASPGEQPGCASDDLQALVEHLELDRFHLVGTAAGAAPSIDYAISHPDRLRGLVIADGTGGVQDPEYLALLERIRSPEFEALPTYLREVSAGYRGINPEGLRRWIEIEHASRSEMASRQRPRNHVTFALLETLRVPTLGIVGDADASTPPACMRLLLARIPNSEYAAIPEAGHAAFWEQPDIWNRLVLDFISRH